MNGTEDSKPEIAVIAAVDMSFMTILHAQMNAAREAGYVVHGVSTRGPNFPSLERTGFRMHAVRIKRSMSPVDDLRAIWHLRRYFRCQGIGIVHTHMPKAGLIGRFAAWLAGVPVVVHTLHGFYFHDNMKFAARWFHIALEWISARCTTVILSQNPEDIGTAVRLGICRRDDIHLLGNGVDLSRFDPDRFDAAFRAAKRTEVGLPPDALVIGIIGRMVREKGYLELFEAMRRIMPDYPNVWLLIIGPEEPEKADRVGPEALDQYGIAHHTRWLGNRDDVPELLACCDLYTLPSWREGFPRSAIEAAAMRLPIVASSIRGCRQVVTDGENGLLVGYRDAQALERGLRRLIEDPVLRRRFGEAGYERSRREFDERRVCKIVLETYADQWEQLKRRRK